MAAYKVLIVDDEMVSRTSISSCLNWAQEGFEVAGEASSGEDALQLMREKTVDILITVIEMPVMDGLELVQQAKILHPAIRVILISSCSDFKYARDAVKLGVVMDYLLKSAVEPGDLARVFIACKDHLDKEMRAKREAQLHIQQEKIVQSKEQEHLVKRLLLGRYVPPEPLPGWMLEPLTVAVWNLDEDDGHMHAGGFDKLMQIEGAYERFSCWCEEGVAVVTGEDELVTVFPDRRGCAQAEIERYHHLLQLVEHHTFTVGISPAVSHYEALGTAGKWARMALERGFYDGRGKCYTGNIPPASINGAISAKEDWTEITEHFSRLLASSDQEGGLRALEKVYNQWQSKQLPKAEVIMQAKGLFTLMASSQLNVQVGEVAERLLENLQSISKARTLGTIQARLTEQFQRLWESGFTPVVAVADSGSAHAVQLAINYIQEHYRGELSLQEVAEYVHMSKNYFSEQFKRLTGMNFIDYVIQLRIQYAKRLLQTTGLRIYDIGLQAGFRSSKHFLKLFKRETSCTPAAYRMRVMQDADQTTG